MCISDAKNKYRRNIIQNSAYSTCGNSVNNVPNSKIADNEKVTPTQKEQSYSFPNQVPKSATLVENEYFNDVVFIGDSITHGIKLYNVSKNALIISQTGINMDTILEKEIITLNNGKKGTVIDAVKQSGKSKIYIMLGSNGVAWMSPDYMVDKYKKFIDKLKQENPAATVYVQSILPITQEKSESDENFTNEKIDMYNKKIYDMCLQNGFNYLNIAEDFKDSSGALPGDASPVDGIHFGTKYYDIWINYIKSHVVTD